MSDRRPAVVLLSGGLDSATCLAVARNEGFECLALSFDYGQRHRSELDAARDLARAAGVEHVVATIDLASIGGSALTGNEDVPKHDDADDVGHGSIPITYVPARNTILLAHALAVAEVRGADDIFLGVNALDYSGYPDCRPEFVAAFEHLARLATRAGTEGGRTLRVRTPLMELTKAGIIELGRSLGVDYATTRSCYDPDPQGRACGRCDACLLRLRGFAELDLEDPAPYQPGVVP